MKTSNSLRKIVVISMIITIVLMVSLFVVFAFIQNGTQTVIGYPPPSQEPTSSAYPGPLSVTSTPEISPLTQIALNYVASNEGISVSSLEVAREETVELPVSEQFYYRVTVVHRSPNELQVFKLYVDADTGQVFDSSQPLREAENLAHEARYGKLEIMLYDRLQVMDDEDEVLVAIWVIAETGESLSELQASIFEELAQVYPAAQTAMEASGKPMDVTDPELSRQINQEYVDRVEEAMAQRIETLVSEVEADGFDVTTYSGMPSFTVILPKWYILELKNHTKVFRIYLLDGEDSPDVESAIPNSFAPTVWQSGVMGNGVTIAVLEVGNVDRNNNYIHHAPVSLLGPSITNHATHVASIAASFHNSLTGMAPEATILSVGNSSDDEAGAVSGLVWAVDEQNARIVNRSGSFYYSDNYLHWIDHAFDYWARYRSVFIAKSVGNIGTTNPSGYVGSPGRGWNMLTVGAYNDQNDLIWSNDSMRSDSVFINTCNFQCGILREKPEVVAVGGSVTALAMNNVPDTNSGTSQSTPQVAGLGALLLDRNPLLLYWPEAARAIIMASATHNIEGPTIIPWDYSGDLKDGAGAINALYADQIAQNFMTPLEICYASCWWPVSLTLTYFNSLERKFYANPGQLVRVAISWSSAADDPAGNYSFDDLLTDFDLSIFAPDGTLIDFSVSSDNNYEMVEFVTAHLGVYRIVITKFESFEASNAIGIAVAGLTLPEKSHLPFFVKP